MTSSDKGERTLLSAARPNGAQSLARLLRDLHVELLDAPAMHLRAVVDAQLGRMGALLGAARLTLWRVDAESGDVTAEFEWFGPSLESMRNIQAAAADFPISLADLVSDGSVLALGGGASSFFGVSDVLAVGLTVGGRLVRLLTVGWHEPTVSGPAELDIDQTVLDTLYSLTAVVHGAAEAAALSERASYDELTGLANRRLLLFMLNHLLSRLGRSNKGGVGVIFCELAETPVAEEVVIRVAKGFQQQTRATDIVGRFDDRILAVLCDDLRDADEAVEVARRLALICRQLDGADGFETAGIAPCFGVGFSSEAVATGVLLRRADLATYQARTEQIGAVRVVSS